MRNLIVCMSVKDSIIEVLKAENLKLKSRIDSLEEKIIKLDISRNKLDQYTRRNNIEIQGIPAMLSDDHLEHKVLNICKSINLTVENSDNEGCHELRKTDNAKLCFQDNVKLFVSENLSPFNQRLAWKFRELRQASKIHSAFSSKGIVKFCHRMNEQPISTEHGRDLTSLYPDSIFKECNQSQAESMFLLPNRVNVSDLKFFDCFLIVYQSCTMS